MVKKEEITIALEQLRKISKERKFAQALDVIINFKHLDIKKNPIDQFITFTHEFSKSHKVCAIIDDDFAKKAEDGCDKVISKSELEKLNNPREVKKLGKEFDFFISQANLMGLVATKFGRILGPLGKMPNPKFGGVVAPGADLKPAVTKFRKSVRVSNKAESIIKSKVGYEDMKDEDLVDNLVHYHEVLSHALPQGDHNIKSFILKFTMSKPIVVGGKEESSEEKKEKSKENKKEPKEEKKEKPKEKKEKSKEKKKEPKEEKKEKPKVEKKDE
jgi:large subunit ribosomal protein L1